MNHRLAAGAAALVLAGGIGLAAAQTGALTEPSTALQLTPQQRTAIYRAVAGAQLRTPPPPNLPMTVGEQIPPATELYALPDTVTAEAPSAKFYRYTVVQNRVVIVDPTNLTVVDVIRP
jgi:hypothetical protein